MSSLNNLLKQQIKDAINHIYDESGSAAENRYSKPEELAKALLDILFPAEAEDNTHVTGVVRVPTAADTESDGSTDSKQRKKRAPMSDEAKAAMKAKRQATIAAKAAAKAAGAPAPADAPAPAPAEEPKSDTEDKKARKPRGPMSDEAKAAMKAKRQATIAAKKAAQA